MSIELVIIFSIEIFYKLLYISFHKFLLLCARKVKALIGIQTSHFGLDYITNDYNINTTPKKY